uniref:AP complex mu/sigma subunit domain-containing protein n=1 Tax=Arion vulgaris TaxID=1028688 RepID=A0A0B6ZUI8_9EUPU
MMQFMLLFSRQGKLRLQKWFVAHPDKTKKKITRELVTLVLARKPKMCSFLEWKDLKVVYKRYASLYFCCAVEMMTMNYLHLKSSTVMWNCWINTSEVCVSLTSSSTLRKPISCLMNSC